MSHHIYPPKCYHNNFHNNLRFTQRSNSTVSRKTKVRKHNPCSFSLSQILGWSDMGRRRVHLYTETCVKANLMTAMSTVLQGCICQPSNSYLEVQLRSPSLMGTWKPTANGTFLRMQRQQGKKDIHSLNYRPRYCMFKADEEACCQTYDN